MQHRKDVINVTFRLPAFAQSRTIFILFVARTTSDIHCIVFVPTI